MKALSAKATSAWLLGAAFLVNCFFVALTVYQQWPVMSETIREYTDNPQKLPFDAVSWKGSLKEPAERPGVKGTQIRLSMVDDLLHRYHLVGMSEAQVLDRLGKPLDYRPGQNIVYTLGHDAQYSVRLTIQLTKGKVIDAHTWTD